jgi:hypothetical protein
MEIVEADSVSVWGEETKRVGACHRWIKLRSGRPDARARKAGGPSWAHRLRCAASFLTAMFLASLGITLTGLCLM